MGEWNVFNSNEIGIMKYVSDNKYDNTIKVSNSSNNYDCVEIPVYTTNTTIGTAKNPVIKQGIALPCTHKILPYELDMEFTMEVDTKDSVGLYDKIVKVLKDAEKCPYEPAKKEVKEEMNSVDNKYKPKKIYRRDKTTIVEWMDGTKSIVVLEDDAPDDSMYHAFCAALAKKMFGSTGKVMSMINKVDEKKINEKKEKLLAVAKKAEEDVKAKQFEEKVRERAEQIAIERAAIKKLKRQHRYD